MENKNIWIVSTLVLGMLLVLSIFTDNFEIEGITGSTTERNIEIEIENYYLEIFNEDVKVVEIIAENGVFRVVLSNSEEVYVSKNGKLMFRDSEVIS